MLFVFMSQNQIELPLFLLHKIYWPLAWAWFSMLIVWATPVPPLNGDDADGDAEADADYDDDAAAADDDADDADESYKVEKS